jgi:hypothetical protein
MGRVWQQEHPERTLGLIDIDNDTASAKRILELLHSGAENQLRISCGQILAPQLRKQNEPASYQLSIDKKGLLSDLRLSSTERRAPRPGEVEVEI